MLAKEENPFVFLRATCHLFYEDLQIKSWFEKAPLAWICGDLHIENFGNYKADNRHVYFDVNDFDEAILAPVTWEIARLLTSIFVATETFKIEKPFAEMLCQHFLDAYSKAIAEGKAYWMGEDTAPPVIEDLLSRKTQVKRKELLDLRTVLDKNRQKRSLKIDNKKAQAISEAQKQKIQDFMKGFAAKQANPEFFKLIDVAQRIAGKGSLGVERYVLLVEGNGSPDGNYLLDLKKALPSARAPSMSRAGICEQPKWSSEADRIVTVHRRSQARPIAFLQAVTIGADSFVLRGLQSTQSPTDHLQIEKWDDKSEESKQLMQSLGNVVAWAHLRSSGRQGSAIADQLIEFAGKSEWKTEVMEYAKTYSQQVTCDWQEFCN